MSGLLAINIQARDRLFNVILSGRFFYASALSVTYAMLEYKCVCKTQKLENLNLHEV